MSGFLRLLGIVLLLGGLAAGAVTGWLFATDTVYEEITAAYARHPNHAIFQAEYWMASLRHWGLLAASIGSVVLALSVGSLLVGVAEVLRRVPRRPS